METLHVGLSFFAGNIATDWVSITKPFAGRTCPFHFRETGKFA
jgi:hypothetical protein